MTRARHYTSVVVQVLCRGGDQVANDQCTNSFSLKPAKSEVSRRDVQIGMATYALHADDQSLTQGYMLSLKFRSVISLMCAAAFQSCNSMIVNQAVLL